MYLEFHVCRLDYPLVAMPSSGCAGTVEQSLAHYWDSHADSSHPLVSVGVAVSDFDGRSWVMQHTLPEDQCFDSLSGDVAAKIAYLEEVNSDA